MSVRHVHVCFKTTERRPIAKLFRQRLWSYEIRRYTNVYIIIIIIVIVPVFSVLSPKIVAKFWRSLTFSEYALDAEAIAKKPIFHILRPCEKFATIDSW